MSFIDGEAGKIFYEEAGEGRPVVMVHGWSANHTFWEPQITALCESYRTIAVDLRGHGRSDKPARGYNFDDHCKDLKRVMSGLGVEDATLNCVGEQDPMLTSVEEQQSELSCA